jgi:hypothetical protein
VHTVHAKGSFINDVIAIRVEGPNTNKVTWNEGPKIVLKFLTSVMEDPSSFFFCLFVYRNGS